MYHKFEMNGQRHVVDVNSGAVHLVSGAVYEMIDHFTDLRLDEIFKLMKDRFSESEIIEAYAEVKEISDAGLLFSADETEAFLPGLQSREPVVKALCLHIAHDCNLRCEYCFADEGEYHGKRALMSAETGKKAIDFLIEKSGRRRNLEIDFFGGEPLMNFDVVKEIVEYARNLESEKDKHFRFTITTNGVLLDEEKLSYINKQMSNIVLSIDGRREVNDRMRKLRGGQGSYDLIIDKFKQTASSRNQTDYYVRGTFTRNNLDFCNDVLHMAEQGFKQISIEPVVAGDDTDYAIRESDLPVIFGEYEKLAKKMSDLIGTDDDFNFFHFMIDLSGGPCVYKRMTGCGAGTEYLAVTPEGDLYPCHQFVGMEDFKLGSVHTGIVGSDTIKTFEGCSVYSKDDCKACWAKYYCGGGCAANAFNFSGDIQKPYKIGCEMQRKRTECAVALAAARLNDENSAIN